MNVSAIDISANTIPCGNPYGQTFDPTTLSPTLPGRSVVLAACVRRNHLSGRFLLGNVLCCGCYHCSLQYRISLKGSILQRPTHFSRCSIRGQRRHGFLRSNPAHYTCGQVANAAPAKSWPMCHFPDWTRVGRIQPHELRGVLNHPMQCLRCQLSASHRCRTPTKQPRPLVD